MSQHIAIIQIEGVLSIEDDLKKSQAHKWARSVYAAMHSQYRCIAVTHNEAELARWWLRRENMAGWATILTNHGSLYGWEDWIMDTIRQFQADAWEIGVLLGTDPGLLRRANEVGVLTLCLGRPLARPGFKQLDEAFQPWQAVVDTLG